VALLLIIANAEGVEKKRDVRQTLLWMEWRKSSELKCNWDAEPAEGSRPLLSEGSRTDLAEVVR
jgi:hypothetical protein